jgi:acyl dehydratase
LHPIHIDPEVAQANSFERPILHGLCTLGIAARMIAEAAGAHPADLKELEARLSSPVLPGDIIEVTANTISSGLNFEARVGSTLVLKGGRATFC